MKHRIKKCLISMLLSFSLILSTSTMAFANQVVPDTSAIQQTVALLLYIAQQNGLIEVTQGTLATTSTVGGALTVTASTDLAVITATGTEIVVAESSSTAVSSALASSGLTATMIAPYIVGAVALGAVAYLGYDLYTNWDDIKEDVYTWFDGRSAYANYYWEEMAQGLLDGTTDFSQGIALPVSLWKDIIACTNDILTFDNTSTFEQSGTIMYGNNDGYLTNTEIANWVSTITNGAETYTTGNNVGAYNSVIMIINEENGYEIMAKDNSSYNYAPTRNIIFCGEVGGSLHIKWGDSTFLGNEGFGLSNAYSSFTQVVNSAFENGGYGWTNEWSLDGLVINQADGTMSWTNAESGLTWKFYFLLSNNSTLAFGNYSYSELYYPLNVQSPYVSYTSYWGYLPWYSNVTLFGLGDNSLVVPNVQQVKPIIEMPDISEMADDDIVTLPVDILKTSPTLDENPDTNIKDLPLQDISNIKDNNNDDDDDENKKLPKIPFLESSDFDMPDILHNALMFIKECFSRIWSMFVANDIEAVLVVPISLAIISIIVGRGFSKKRGG